MASSDRSRSPMCCRSCAECSCDHRGIITRQNLIIARQEHEIAVEKIRANHLHGLLMNSENHINTMNEHKERLVRLNAQIVANAARATLECKRDADDRVEAQRATITRLQQELAAKDTEVNNL